MKNPVLDTAKEKARTIKENIVTALELAKEYPEDEAIIKEMVMPYYMDRDKAEGQAKTRVRHGGSWVSHRWLQQVTHRDTYLASLRNFSLGFRVVKNK
jgi:formylglycine-generating enzyme required for sulfatase activity